MSIRPMCPHEARLHRIAEAHTPQTDRAGGISGYCPECERVYPCPTLVWATTPRNSWDVWDPADEPDDDPVPPPVNPPYRCPRPEGTP